MPTSTVEDYLKYILLEQLHAPEALVSMGQIAAALQVAPGTVTAMVKTLADSDLVTYEPYSGVRLTDSGRKLAAHVLRRHRLIELFLVKVMGMDWTEVHSEAEEMEHAVSDRLIGRMDEMLGYPSVDPHGDPIPDVHGEMETPVLPSLATCELGAPLRVARVADQSREFLQLVERRGLKPGSRLRVDRRDEAADTIALRLAGGGDLSLGLRAASKILVEPVDRDDRDDREA
jgi:DtxR family Mn-dependent transcriptional regulator